MKEKPIVHYRTYETYIRVGLSAYVYPVDHYATDRVSNESIAITSVVLSYDKDTGIFETLNTIYKPEV